MKEKRGYVKMGIDYGLNWRMGVSEKLDVLGKGASCEKDLFSSATETQL